MTEKWREGDTLGKFLKREKVKGTVQQLKHEHQVSKDLRARNRGDRDE